MILYCIFDKKLSSEDKEEKKGKIEKTGTVDTDGYSNNDGYILPDHIIGRINLCIETFNIIMKSKPDKFHTTIIIVSRNEYLRKIKEMLTKGGISEQYLENDLNSKTIDDSFNNVLHRIEKLTNPPCIYFIGSVWQKGIFDSIVSSKLKNYTVLFEGALDHRHYDVVEKEKLVEEPKKGSEYYKRKLTNKAIDALLNYIFSNKQQK
ncbi:MAG: hypothetical protein M3162_00445 [Thermoproteota archaeon]|nr:hypothetical protein [Thermoproteota archaeon]